MPKTGSEIRRAFLEFFEERGHAIVPSAPVYPKDDPTLLFTNAGMNQFKDIFLGSRAVEHPRVTDTQKCLRVSGKHNDLEEVGRDTYHHTFFEMLGNWSFGDYFKRDAIRWAWVFLTDVCGLPKDKLWVTVFEGDEALGVPADDEAAGLWAELTDVDPSHILKFGKKDNFWEMGATGPCGPCSEIHLDRGGPHVDPTDGANREIGVNAGNERFVELWNLVFIQYNRGEDGALSALSAQHVDTGMGFERLVATLQGKVSNYDSDLFTPILDHIGRLAGAAYGDDPERDIAFRVIADHARALTISITDGVLPSNEGRGYVLRRLLRRASVFGRRVLGIERPFVFELAPTIAGVLGDAFVELTQRLDHVQLVIRAEEESFGRTIDKGLTLFNDLAVQAEARPDRTIPGAEAYDLYSTCGFPRDLLAVLARDRGLDIDWPGWDMAKKTHQEASRGGAGATWAVDPAHVDGLPATRVLFYEVAAERTGDLDVRPLKLIGLEALVLEATPFYAEAGGQVGDTGAIVGDGFAFEVQDTQKLGDVIVHLGALREGDAAHLPAVVHPRVDAARRRAIMANHTATHLLHAALKRVLGPHATQQGSLVAPDRLRFDFTHAKAMTPEELSEVEAWVNVQIANNHAVETSIEDLDAAKARGVVAMFGEKYDQQVRVLSIGGVSAELCGGTHTHATSEIGMLLVTDETAVQAGVRRIEAVTRLGALRRAQAQRHVLREAASRLQTAEDRVPERIDQLQAKLSELGRQVDALVQQQTRSQAQTVIDRAEQTNGAVVVAELLTDGDAKRMATLADELRSGRDDVCGVVGVQDGDKALLAVFASRALTKKGVHAGNIVRDIAGLVGGRGGGRPDFARAGGSEPAALPAAIEAGKAKLIAALAR